MIRLRYCRLLLRVALATGLALISQDDANPPQALIAVSLTRTRVSGNPGGTGGGISGNSGNADMGGLASAGFSETDSRFGVKSNLTRSATSACCLLIMSLHDSGVSCSLDASPDARCGVRAMSGDMCLNWLTKEWLLG